jgi:hypothetical protein
MKTFPAVSIRVKVTSLVARLPVSFAQISLLHVTMSVRVLY